VFGALIQPILQRHCSACHGPEKHKADLSMESYETLLKGGKNGPVLIASRAFDSPMIHRLLLPLKDEDHMPPDGKPQPTLAEIAALQWWIDCGAPADTRIGDLKPGAEVRTLSPPH
jgi:mono/diheme cytochrome c family protein